MNNEQIDKVVEISSSLIELEKYKEALDLLLPYKKEFDDYLKANPNSLSFSEAFHKDLYMEFYGKKNPDFKEIPHIFMSYYSNLNSCFLGLDDLNNDFEVNLKMRKLDPANFNCFFSTTQIILQIYRDSLHLPLLINSFENAFRFATHKEDLALVLESYGKDFIGDTNREVAFICLYRAYQLYPTKARENKVKYYSRFVKASKLATLDTMRAYSRKYNFPIDFNSRVKKLALNCTASEMLRKNQMGYRYYFSFLSEVDEKYNDESKISIDKSFEPIKTYYNEFLEFKPSKKPTKEFTIDESIKNIKDSYKEMTALGYNKKEAISKMIEIFGFDHYDEEQPLLQMYYFFDCLNLKEPKYVMDNLNVERKEFCKSNNIDEKLKNIENNDKFIGNQAVGYLLYTQFLNYFSRKISLDNLTYICLFLGYHLPSSYVKKSRKSQAVSDCILIDDYGNKYQIVLGENARFIEFVKLD